MKNKFCIQRVKNCILVENHGGPRCRNFAKRESWKVHHVKLFRYLGQDITTGKTLFFILQMFLSLILYIFKKNPEEKNF